MTVVPSFDVSFSLLIQVALLLVAARGLGWLAAQLGVTRVVGELATGFVLGPSILGTLAPGVASALFPRPGLPFLEVLSLLGLVLLLTLAGMEMDFDLVQRNRSHVASIGAVGLAVPFGLGVALGYAVPRSILTETTTRPVFALFLATALSISAIPVIVRILLDLDVFDHPLGQLTVAVAMFTDVVGWLLLSVVVGIARTGRLDVRSLGTVLAALVGFLAVSLVVGQRLIDASFARLDDERVGAQLGLLVVVTFVGSAVTIGLGVEPALGAFVVGLLVARSGEMTETATDAFERVTVGVFAPLFFGIAGLRADLGLLLDPTVALVGTVTLLVATVGKIGGVYVVASWLGYSRPEALGMGAGLNARGAVEIVIAALGLELGVLSVELYTVVLGVAIVTSAMAPPMLRVTLGRLPNRRRATGH